MRYRLTFAALLLPLAGCVVPPPAPYAPYPGYPQAGYPGYPPSGYPPAYGQPDFAYPGYAYVDGSPTYFADGATWPLVFYGGAWGYWDGYNRWHVAPGPIGGYLGRRYPGGAGYRPWGGGPHGGPGGFPGGPRGFGGPPGGAHPGPGGPGRGPAPPPGVHPAAAPAHAAPPARSRAEEHH
jgi:hypothetical protein